MLGIGRAGPLGRDDCAMAGGGCAAPAGGIAERDAWVVLAGVTGVGPVSFGRLVEVFGGAAKVLLAATEPAATSRLVAATCDRDGGSPSLAPAAAAGLVAVAAHPEPALEAVRRSGVAVVTLADDAYPGRLRLVGLPPPVLFILGEVAAMDRAHAVAVVGTRRPTALGRATAGRIAEAVGGLGATVVSGLAFGIDAAAHAGAVRIGSPTVAVIGGGHERLYPASHRGLAREIVRGGGAVVSEFAPDTVPSRGTFPRRNRIISGLSDATVVVEAGARSGALTTAAWALEQGRGLYLVPGRLDDPAVAGCLAFLREAGPEARVVAGIPELLEDLGLLPGFETAGARSSAQGGTADVVLAALGPSERAVAAVLAAGRGTVDEIIAGTGLAGATVLGVLTSLELRGLTVEVFGRYRAAGALAATGTHAATGASGRSREPGVTLRAAQAVA